MKKNKIIGKYIFKDNKVVPDENASLIQRKIEGMLFISGSMTTEIPAIYFEKTENQYWQCWDFPDGTKELKLISKASIIKEYPSVSLDEMVKVHYPKSDEKIPDIYIGELKSDDDDEDRGMKM